MPQEIERIKDECGCNMDVEALAQLDIVIETLPAALGAAGDSLAAPEEPLAAAAPVPAAPASAPLPTPSLARPAAGAAEQQARRSGGGSFESEQRPLAASSHRNSQTNIAQGWASPAVLDKRPPSFHELQRVMQDYHDQQQIEQSSRLHASSSQGSSSQANGNMPNGR
jgi:hypothetical protein